jgi:cystathionine beta-lyase/cystathionine gamma-synthase
MRKHARTRAIHSGEEKDRSNRGIPPVVSLTSTFFFKNAEELQRHKEGTDPREEYGRYHNPTRAAAERKLADLEGAEDAILCSSGMYAIAGFLNRQPNVRRVFYPSLSSQPNCDVAKRQMTGFGGVVSFDLGTVDLAKKFVDALSIPYIAPSLGGTESLVIPYSVVVPPTIGEEKSGIFKIEPGLVRRSVGLEDKDDLIEELTRALNAIL